ncbi:MAG: HAD-IC family P-type ATPase [Candidatus Curtissbacteria bacterium]|nr:HAD-IC family P-type ATPase [Candidatus Curtissbacteria bacterium]
MNWYQKTVEASLEELEVDLSKGLSQAQVQDRLKTIGPNVLASKRKETLLGIFAKQFKSPLIYILILAAILVIFLGQGTDAVVIIAVLVINALIGTIQEGKARNSLEKLKSLTKHRALVRRDGQETLISADEVVPGDIIILHEGDRVVADARIVESQSLTVDESILTGEAYTVSKTHGNIAKDGLVVGDQKNMVFSGTSISSGFAQAVVVSTGLSSELGKISKDILETSNIPLPLEKKVTKLSHLIAFSVAIIASVIFIIGVLRGIPTREIFTAVVGLSVSIVPEGLPVAVTIVLARGVWRMVKIKAIVRQMAAVEAMGSADTLLVDKTGTITTGNMLIKQIVLDGKTLTVGGDGYTPEGEIKGGKSTQMDKLKTILGLTYLSLKADVIKEDGQWKPTGDPTEAAIAVLCQKAGLSRAKLLEEYETIQAKPFDAEKRYIEATFAKGKQKWDVFVGAPDFLSRDLKIDHGLNREYEALTAAGMRVVGIAIYSPPKKLFGYTLLAIDEEIRSGVDQSVKEAKKAGFKIAMMTGDFPATAKSIAGEVGIFISGDKVLTGEEVEKMSEEELAGQIGKVSVFARITPQHKLKIVKAFKTKGHIVAMTGDGVNDAPALQAANLGIGIGSGTQVAKDASDIILVDSNFSTITAAIAEGRGIYQTLKKVILYLFSTGLGEVLAIASAIAIGLPLPVVAVQIIWLNFVTDGFLVVALAQDPPQTSLTRDRSQNLIDRQMAGRIFLMGATMLAVTLPIFYFYQAHSSLTAARSMALVVLSLTQWFNALNVRSKERSIFKSSITNNWFLIGAFAIVIALDLFAVQTPLGNNLLHTTPLTLDDWLLALGASSIIIIVEEIRKLLARSKNSARQTLSVYSAV